MFFVPVQARVDVALAQRQTSRQKGLGALGYLGEVQGLARFPQRADHRVQAVIHLRRPRKGELRGDAYSVVVDFHAENEPQPHGHVQIRPVPQRAARLGVGQDLRLQLVQRHRVDVLYEDVDYAGVEGVQRRPFVGRDGFQVEQQADVGVYHLFVHPNRFGERAGKSVVFQPFADKSAPCSQDARAGEDAKRARRDVAAQRLSRYALQLPDALARDAYSDPDRVQRVSLAVFQAEPKPDNPYVARGGECGERIVYRGDEPVVGGLHAPSRVILQRKGDLALVIQRNGDPARVRRSAHGHATISPSATVRRSRLAVPDSIPPPLPRKRGTRLS